MPGSMAASSRSSVAFPQASDSTQVAEADDNRCAERQNSPSTLTPNISDGAPTPPNPGGFS